MIPGIAKYGSVDQVVECLIISKSAKAEVWEACETNPYVGVIMLSLIWEKLTEETKQELTLVMDGV